jgi:hypothetical protein
MYFKECVVARRVRTNKRWARVLEMAAEIREATLGYGARSTSTSMMTSSRPKWANATPKNEEDYRDGRSGEVWRRDVLEDQLPPENPVRRA